MRRRASRDGRALESAFPVPVHRGWSSRGRLRLSLLVDARNSRRPESQRVPGNWRARSPDAAAVSLGGIAAVEPAARFSSYEAFSRQPFCMSSNKSESLFETRPIGPGGQSSFFRDAPKYQLRPRYFRRDRCLTGIKRGIHIPAGIVTVTNCAKPVSQCNFENRYSSRAGIQIDAHNHLSRSINIQADCHVIKTHVKRE